MKKSFKLTLTALAIFVGVGGAFAARLDAQAWFYLNSSGQPTGTALPGDPDCASGNLNCAQQYTIDGAGHPVAPVGQPTKGAIHP